MVEIFKVDKVALLVVFNHRFDRNLPRLRELYKEKFSNVFFLMPFYDGNDEDVIPVYYPSNCFQGFFQTAYQVLKNKEFDYWFIVADDMVINPSITENNITSTFSISKSDSFIPTLCQFNDELSWPHARKSLAFNLNDPFIENKRALPSNEECYEALAKYGVEPLGLRFENVYKNIGKDDYYRAAICGSRYLKDKKELDSNSLLYGDYPFCFAYSDILVIGKDNIERFCHYCGIFAASGLFVEIAVPTAMLLATKGKVVNQADAKFAGKPLWGNDVEVVLGKYNFNLDRLISDFPDNYLFLHPVKLSQWK